VEQNESGNVAKENVVSAYGKGGKAAVIPVVCSNSGKY